MNASRSTPAVSVVVPAFNCASTIAATIASVAAQSIAGIEILIIDDGSRDDTRAVITRLAEADPRIVVVSQCNQGVSATRNRGIRLAKAPIVAFIDGDDLWAREHLATHLARFAATPHLGVSFSAARYIDSAGRVSGRSRVAPGKVRPEDILYSNPATTCSTLVVRRRVFDCCGMFDEALARSEDQEWLFRVAVSAWRVEGIEDTLVDYRMSPAGLASDLDRMHAGYEVMLERAKAIAPQLVSTHEASARASEDLYLARRALQLAHGQSAALRYLSRALRTAPRIVWDRPRSVLAVVAHMLFPAQPALPPSPTPAVVQEA